VVDGATEADASGEAKRVDADPKRLEGRPELKEQLRLLDTKITYGPDRKEGTQKFDHPFAQYAAG